jgi:release factor glutamine methyltransferase
MSALEWGAFELRKAGKPSPRLDAEILLAHLAGVRRLELYLNFDKPIGESDAREYVALIRRRLAGEPVAYIIGKREFYSREFRVGPEVLVPRPETECMVEAALKAIAGMESVSILDLCTGSGIIAATLAAEIPGATTVATDISAAALAMAGGNIRELGLDGRVTLVEGDLFEPIGDRSFDLIASNPPYIPSAMVNTLQVEISHFEPRVALDGGPDGLDFIKRIVKAAPLYMNDGAWLFVEIADGMAGSVEEVVRTQAFLGDFSLGNDLSGTPRFFSARRR